MGQKRQEVVEAKQTSKVWLRADFEFPSTFSYRQPDASAQFAIGSPVPSPATIKLALVDTAIRWSGCVGKGRDVFDWLKTCCVETVPPERVVRFRVFLKRLKPREGKLLESTGVRDYFLLDGKLQVFLQVPCDKAEEVKDLLGKVRKLGTSDSLCWCCEVNEIRENELPEKLFPCRLDTVSEELLRKLLVQGFIVTRMSDLTEKSEFDGFNPFGGDTKKSRLEKAPYLLPLKMELYGETWAVLRRTELPSDCCEGR